MPCSLQNSRVFAQARVEAQSESLQITIRLRACQYRVVTEGGQFAQNHRIRLAHVCVHSNRGLNADAQPREYRTKKRLCVCWLLALYDRLDLCHRIGNRIWVRRKEYAELVRAPIVRLRAGRGFVYKPERPHSRLNAYLQSRVKLGTPQTGAFIKSAGGGEKSPVFKLSPV